MQMCGCEWWNPNSHYSMEFVQMWLRSGSPPNRFADPHGHGGTTSSLCSQLTMWWTISVTPRQPPTKSSSAPSLHYSQGQRIHLMQMCGCEWWNPNSHYSMEFVQMWLRSGSPPNRFADPHGHGGTTSSLCSQLTMWWNGEKFKAAFRGHHIPARIMDCKLNEFLALTQGSRTVLQYAQAFNDLCQYVGYHADTDEKKRDSRGASVLSSVTVSTPSRPHGGITFSLCSRLITWWNGESLRQHLDDITYQQASWTASSMSFWHSLRGIVQCCSTLGLQ